MNNIVNFQSKTETMQPIGNETAEQGLLGAILSNIEWLYRLPPDFDAKHFSNQLHASIYQEICKDADAGKTPTPITLRGRFGAENDRYLIQLAASAIAVVDIKNEADVVIDAYRRREIVAHCQNAIQKALDLGADVEAGEIVASLHSSLDEVNSGKSRYQVSSEQQVTMRIVERLTQGEIPRSSTGLSVLDAAMDGGMYAGKLYGLVARKKMGKTMMLGTISTHLKNSGEKHLYLALEMGSEEIQQRSLAMQFGNYTKAFRVHDSQSPQFIQRIADYAVVTQPVRYYVDAPGLTFTDLRHILPLYVRKFGIKGFILDCWQLVGGKQRSQSLAEHQDHVAQWLAEACKKHGIWGLVTAQENQDGNTRGGEGLRLACDQAYRLCKKDPSSEYAWMELMDTRYTAWNHVGDENNPRLIVSAKGTHFEQYA